MAATFALSPADLLRQNRLRRAKVFATGLLLVAAAVFVLVQPAVHDGATWAGYVAAAAEAGMIGVSLTGSPSPRCSDARSGSRSAHGPDPDPQGCLGRQPR